MFLLDNVDEEVLSTYKHAERELHDFFSDNFGRLCAFCAFVTEKIKYSNKMIQSKYWCCCTGSKIWLGWQFELAMREYGEDFQERFKETAVNNCCIAQSSGCPLDVGRPFECNKLICHHQYSIAGKINSHNPTTLTGIITAYEGINTAVESNSFECMTFNYYILQQCFDQYKFGEITDGFLLEEDSSDFVHGCLQEFIKRI